MNQERDDAYKTMQDAFTTMLNTDAAFTAALVAEHGPDHAGDIRYQRTKQSPLVRHLGDAFSRASEQYHRACEAYREAA